ncbi:hypothetical protein LCGC14_1547350, partial [marine sediment metagenome]|nr:cyclic nucleotide-binding domain-containing protein [Pricia sp.]
VEKALTFKPDIILCDVMMPIMDGYGVLRELAKHSGTATIPFIFLTAKAERADMRLGMDMGADDYLTKPFKKQELLDAINSRLKKNDFLRSEIANTYQGLNTFLQEASKQTDVRDISKGRELRRYKKKDCIFEEGKKANTLFFIETGTVKTYKLIESGKEFVTGIWGPGDFIGQLSLLNVNGHYLENAAVMESAEICEIPKADFTGLLYGNPTVSRKFIDMISNSLTEIQEQLIAMAFAPVRQRTAKALLQMVKKGMIQNNFEGGIAIPRDDLAGIVGTTKESAVRTLTDFKNEGLIAMDSGRRIILLNPEGLKMEADF